MVSIVHYPKVHKYVSDNHTVWRIEKVWKHIENENGTFIINCQLIKLANYWCQNAKVFQPKKKMKMTDLIPYRGLKVPP